MPRKRPQTGAREAAVPPPKRTELIPGVYRTDDLGAGVTRTEDPAAGVTRTEIPSPKK